MKATRSYTSDKKRNKTNLFFSPSKLRPKTVLQTKSLQRKSEGGGIATSALASQLNNSKGSGSPLPTSTNSFMSNAFGTDFSKVRVHTSDKAIQMNQNLNARAFTHGSDVYFNKGEYAPNSSSGKQLLAHELTHVVQQNSSGSPKVIQRDPKKGEDEKGAKTKVEVVTKHDFTENKTEATTKQSVSEEISDAVSAEASVKTTDKDRAGALKVKVKDKKTGLSAAVGAEQKQSFDPFVSSKDTYSLTVGGERKFFDKRLVLSAMFTSKISPHKKPIFSFDGTAVVFPEGTLTPSFAFQLLSDPKDGETYSFDAGLEFRITDYLSTKAGIGMDLKDGVIAPRVGGAVVFRFGRRN
ncbi:MAG: DUF4157 domain-containing protein [Bacteroidota bacterium]